MPRSTSGHGTSLPLCLVLLPLLCACVTPPDSPKRYEMTVSLMQDMATEMAAGSPDESGKGRLVVGPDTEPTTFAHLAPESAVCAGTILGARVRLLVESVTSDAQQTKVLASGRCLSLDLPATDIVRLRLLADSRAELDDLYLARPRIKAEKAPPRKPNVIVYLVDCLRADMLAAYGGSPQIAPQMNAYADSAVAIPSCMAQSSWTRASVAALFTGLWPLSTGVNGRNDALSDASVTIAEVLKERAGYTTAAMITNGNVGDQFGFDQGFDEFFKYREGKGAQLHVLSDHISTEFFRWVDSHDGEKPFFIYIHTIDPHAPYAPYQEDLARVHLPDFDPSSVTMDLPGLERLKEKFSDRFGPDVMGLEAGSTLWMQGLAGSLIKPTPAMCRRLRALYELEVSFNDRSFGQLVQGLRQRGLDRNTVLFLIGDHGEEFFEHRGFEHGRNLYETLVAVPLVVGMPEGFPPLNTKRPAELIDIFPTITDLAGVESPPGLEGLSLLSHAGDQTRPRYSYLDLDSKHAVCIHEDRWKLIRTRKGRRMLTELYDLQRDPGETEDVSKDFPMVVSFLSAKLDQRIESSLSPAEHRDAEITDDLREELEALGYLDTDRAAQ